MLEINIDIAIVICYFIILFSIACWSSRKKNTTGSLNEHIERSSSSELPMNQLQKQKTRNNRSYWFSKTHFVSASGPYTQLDRPQRSHTDTINGSPDALRLNQSNFFFAQRRTPWWAIAGSLFASSIGAQSFIGLSGAAATFGFVVGAFEWHACWIMIVFLSWIFTPIFLSSQVLTTPGYLFLRYRSLRLLRGIAVVSLIIIILASIPCSLYAGAMILHFVFDFSILTSTVSFLSITVLFSVVGGLNTVIYTDVFQTIILLVGGCLMTGYYLQLCDGWSGLEFKLNALELHNFFSVVRPSDDLQFPWFGVFFGIPILTMTKWCTDQVIVQRVLSAKNETHAHGGILTAGWLHIITVFITIIPGMIARVLFPTEVKQNPDAAYPLLISKLPAGMLGILVAAMLATILSSLSSLFISSATLFTIDIYPVLRRRCKGNRYTISKNELIMVGRIFYFCLVLPSLLLVPVIKEINGIFVYYQSIYAYISPPIAVIFLAGVLWRKATERGAIAALIIGCTLGCTRLIMEIAYSVFHKRESFLAIPLFGMNFLNFAIINFSVSFLFMIIFSNRSYRAEMPTKETISALAEPLMDYNSVPGKVSKHQIDSFVAPKNWHPLTNLTWSTLESNRLLRSNRNRVCDRYITFLGFILIVVIFILFLYFL